MAVELALLIPSLAVLIVTRTRRGLSEGRPEPVFVQSSHWRVVEPRLAPVVSLRPRR